MTAHNCVQQRLIPFQDGHVQYCQSAVQLGCNVDVPSDGKARLSAVMAKGSYRFPVFLGQMMSMKLPMSALLRAVRVRMIPAVMLDVELVVIVPFSEICRTVGMSFLEETWDDCSASQRTHHRRQFARTCVLPAFRRHEVVFFGGSAYAATSLATLGSLFLESGGYSWSWYLYL